VVGVDRSSVAHGRGALATRLDHAHRVFTEKYPGGVPKGSATRPEERR
jgi:hypothetical protein